MHFTVHIKPCGFNLKVKSGETVLAAALRQGLHFPHDCQNGVCGSCKGRLLEGQVTYDDAMLPALPDSERDEGYALFCSAIPVTDLIIEINNVITPQQLPIKELLYTVETFEEIAPTVYRVFLHPPEHDHIDYLAGQYIEILQKDSSPLPFSIANAPLGDKRILELHIRDKNDHSPLKNLLHEMRTAKKVNLKGPFGSCILQREPNYPIIFTAGGTGIAPIKALLEQALAEGYQQDLYLYWGVRILSDFYLQNLISRWEKYIPNFHYRPILSGLQDKPKWKGETGWVNDAVIQEHSDLSRFHIYASGPPEMVYSVLHSFEEHNLNRSLLYSDILDYWGKI